MSTQHYFRAIKSTLQRVGIDPMTGACRVEWAKAIADTGMRNAERAEPNSVEWVDSLQWEWTAERAGAFEFPRMEQAEHLQKKMGGFANVCEAAPAVDVGHRELPTVPREGASASDPASEGPAARGPAARALSAPADAVARKPERKGPEASASGFRKPATRASFASTSEGSDDRKLERCQEILRRLKID